MLTPREKAQNSDLAAYKFLRFSKSQIVPPQIKNYLYVGIYIFLLANG